ncbi:preprotein translocase subunit SecG [Chitinimonas koreensis]|uniref:preprotein translocase subunit SecG n=1 Tax=Chitinimonas koreensis TaxID=356302 RepID=UPI0004088F58|nr:preprotein translocase subunit SecG [Chitinimonas koreensis]QNM97514.1 preprotein translocase subunit SecG [Chitinimonas koreensis]
MEVFKGLIQIINVLSALTVIVLVLLQHGKGADMGAAFGSGSSGSLFGASGSANFLSRTTAVCATIFFLTLFMLVKVDAGGAVKSDGVMSGVVQEQQKTDKQGQPAKPAQNNGQSSIPN